MDMALALNVQVDMANMDTIQINGHDTKLILACPSTSIITPQYPILNYKSLYLLAKMSHHAPLILQIKFNFNFIDSLVQ